MPRNLDRRIELLVSRRVARRQAEGAAALDAMFQDNVKARRLQADGTYRRRRPAKGEEPFRVQVYLYQEAKRALDRVRAAAGVTLEPLTSP